MKSCKSDYERDSMDWRSLHFTLKQVSKLLLEMTIARGLDNKLKFSIGRDRMTESVSRTANSSIFFLQRNVRLGFRGRQKFTALNSGEIQAAGN